MKKITYIIVLLIFSISVSFSQEVEVTEVEEKPSKSKFKFYGNLDAYYQYDFAGTPNLKTSFTETHNSFSLGYLLLGMNAKLTERVNLVTELSFGPRSSNSIPSVEEGGFYNIQNAYFNYELSDKFNLQAGYMATFVGYELINPADNLNYSTSYLFTNGPFQNPGAEIIFAPTDGFQLMGGVFNGWNDYTNINDELIFGGQLLLSKDDDFLAINYLSPTNQYGTIIDLTAGKSLGESWSVGLNAAYFENTSVESNYAGAALYVGKSLGEHFSLNLREEYFTSKNILDERDESSVIGSTLTLNYDLPNVRFILEGRTDMVQDDKKIFVDADNNPANSQFSVLVAAVVSF